MIEEQLDEVKKNIQKACKKCGRDIASVKLIAVSKFKPISAIEEAIAAGQTVFGENRVQELCEKYEHLHDKYPQLEWHLIGHLQTNKVKYIIDKAAMIHSVDSLKLAEEISKQAQKANLIMPILLEVNVAKEESKFGFYVEELENAVQKIALLPGLKIKGFMTIAPFVEKAEENRKYFKKMYDLYVDIQCKNIDNIELIDLSMGMTGDYEVAIEEGATMVRVGTGIFGSR